jgi:hypothetical protein
MRCEADHTAALRLTSTIAMLKIFVTGAVLVAATCIYRRRFATSSVPFRRRGWIAGHSR